MFKKYQIFFVFLMVLMANSHGYAGGIHSNKIESIVEAEVNLFTPEINKSFIFDSINSTKEMIRICVPIFYPKWIAIPASCVEKMTVIDEKAVEGVKYSF